MKGSDPVLAKARVDFLQRHSGKRGIKQCKKHPRLADMRFPQVLDALKEETGLGISRFWYEQLCDRLGIERWHQAGHPPTPLADKRSLAAERKRRWRERVKADPERLAQAQAKSREDWKKRKERGWRRPQKA